MRVVVYGGGVAARMAAAELADKGIDVDLVGPSASWPMLPEGGIALGEDPDALYRDSIACGGYLAPRAPVRAMSLAARSIVDELERWGVPFDRDDDGGLALRRLPGAREPSAAFVECRTTEMCVRALEGRLRRQGVRRHEPFELVALVRDTSGRCVGAVMQHLVSMKMHLFACDGLVLAAGGAEKLFIGGEALAAESALGVALEAGALGCNLDCVQLHPAALRRGQRMCLLSSAVRSESGRLRTEERQYFLEEAHPGWGALAPDDLCAHAVARVCFVREEDVYLDLRHLPEARLVERLESELSACEIITGVDMARAPLAVTPAAAGCLGGLWVDHERSEDGGLVDGSPRNHRTSIEGLYAVGDSAALYHGSSRLGGTGLLAALFGARLGARALASYLDGAAQASEPPSAALSDAKKSYKKLRLRKHREGSAADIHDRLRFTMEIALGLRPEGEEDDLDGLREEYAALGACDTSKQANRGAPALRDLERMLLFARACDASRRARTDPARALTVRLVDGELSLDSIAVDVEDMPPEPRRYAEDAP